FFFWRPGRKGAGEGYRSTGRAGTAPQGAQGIYPGGPRLEEPPKERPPASPRKLGAVALIMGT
ncbi:MAG: hypothetical protein ACK56I_24210, partial [bacterium]